MRGPWRAVPVLGVTQIVAWGTIFYSPVLTVPLIAAERGWSLSFTMGGFSIGAAGRGPGVAVRRPLDRSLRRPCGDDRRLAGQRAGTARPRRSPAIRLPISRSGWCSARALARRSTIPPSPRSDASSAPPRAGRSRCSRWPAASPRPWAGRRRISCSARSAGAAPIWSMPRCSPRSAPRCMPSRCRAAAPRSTRRRPDRPRAAGGGAAAARHRLHPGHRGLHRLRLRAVGAVGASARDLRPHRHRCRRPWC